MCFSIWKQLVRILDYRRNDRENRVPSWVGKLRVSETKLSLDKNGKRLRIVSGRQAAIGPTAIPRGAEKGICLLSCVNYLSHCQQTLLMRMGVANVYFGLCHMAAHVTLLTPKDDSNLEVERTLAMSLLFIQRTIPNLTPSGICPR